MATDKKKAKVKKSAKGSSKRVTGPRTRPKDKRCRFCRKKALPGKDTCGGFHPTVQPRLRENLRNGRGSFLRSLLARISNVPIPTMPYDDGGVLEYRLKVLNVVDDAAQKYKGS